MKIVEGNLDLVPPIAILFDAYRVWYGQEANLAAATTFLHDRLRKQESVLYAAMEGDRPVGFTQLYPLFSSTRMARLWLLNDLYVHPESRGKGISIKLIERAKTLTRDTGAAGLSLETERNNQIGNQLYPRTNFEVDTEHFYYFWKNPEFTSR
ncbi:MAG: GNAT family N-acetyltransferase [Saprospiraceae bacterium]|nr:GNAT family N-acetyltransferase [Saprospiraceae bacterium]